MLTAAIIVYAFGFLFTLFYAAFEGALTSYRSTMVAAAFLWPVVLVTFAGISVMGLVESCIDMHESRHWYKRSWPRIIRDYPVLGRLYKFFTFGSGR